MIDPPPTTPDVPPPSLLGRASLHRNGGWLSATHELTQGGNVLAQLGRAGWLKIYMGSGQRITIGGGEQWRIRAVGAHGSMIPVIFDAHRRRIATAGSNYGTYGITGKGFAYSLYPAEKPRIGRADRWILREFEDELATITRYPLSVDAATPVHLGVVLLSFILVRHGLPEDSIPRIPSFRWS